MVNFPTHTPNCDPALLDLFLYSDTSICCTMAFPPFGNSDHFVVSVSIDFPSNSQWDAPFHPTAYDYPCANWYSLHDHLRDVPWDDIIKFSTSAAGCEFSGVRLGLMYMSLIISIRSSVTYLHGFQLLVQLL